MRGTAMTKPSKIDEYDIKDAARTLIRAKEIAADKKLYPLAKAELEKQAAAALEAAADARVESNVSKKLKDTFKG
jgi:hypothetical protein